MYEVVCLQNCSNWDSSCPTVKIDNQHPHWMVAYTNWLFGKAPTNDPEWKKGVYAITIRVYG